MKKPSRVETAQTAWLLVSSALVLLGGVLLLAGLAPALVVFAASAAGQAAYIFVVAPRFFDRDDPPDARGRQQTTNAFVLYLAATAFIGWAWWRGRLTPLGEATAFELGAVGAALLLYAWYVARTMWWTLRKSSAGVWGSSPNDDDVDPEPYVPTRPLHTSQRIKLMAEMNIAERRLPQDGRIRVTLHGNRVDIRVSTIPTVHGESIVMRLLDRGSVFLPLEKLGFGPRTLARFDALIRRPHGIVLVTGPTGSGKTTTLYGALDKINSSDRKIITVEDPVEYQLKGVNQIPVKPKIGLTFATGLRHIVRQDPDVILIGEIRDLETAEIAIQASLTGHLVFSTLHTNDAPGAITRLQDMGVEPYLIASVLEGVLAQRLVRRVCPACRVPDTPGAADLGALGIEGAADVRLWRGRGCGECRGTGYRGRTGIYELFVLTEDARSLILRRAPGREIRRAALDAGMLTLRLDGWAKACEGVTTVEEILRVTQEDA